jgi:eukaryotic-like serine/threonine-protein kinase
MQPENWQKVKAVFDSIVQLEANERSAYLRNVCADDAELLREVEALLAASDAAEGFMEMPFAGEVADLLQYERDQLQPGQTFNRYKIIRKIGVGGMGKVYLAQDTHLKRPVAIKLLSADATRDPAQVLRFVQEARFASLLNHPNIITIYEIGQSGDLHFISTEFVSGETLRDRLVRDPLKTKDAVDIAIDVASALVAAHEADVVHRDIKPENIMLRDDGFLKVLDFGLAKLSRNQKLFADPNGETWHDVKTNPGVIVGTVAYMSPEQASGIDVDARTDIWSLGVVLYEMIIGRPPFEGLTAGETMASILKVDPKPLKNTSSNKLKRIIRKALSKLPEERYQTMREMLLDLKSVEGGAAGVEHCSVAILPFVNITGDASANFFEFALADAVITELARSSCLVVRPSSSITKYLGKIVDPLAIGNELKVDAILAANFLVTKNRIRVTTQLIDVLDKNVLWGEQIDSDADDIIGLQDTITHRIVEGLKIELKTSTEPEVAMPVTDNSLAYMEYLRGRDQLRRYMFHTVANENVEIAIGHFKRAIELDPRFALAHSALGTSYLQRVLKVMGNREDLEIAAAALDRALSLGPQIIEARAYRTFITRVQGEAQKSREQIAELRRDAPNNFEVQYLSAACYRFDGDYENAFRCYVEMLRIDPTAQVAVHYCRARIFKYSSEFDKAFRELEQAEKLEPNHPIVKFFHAVITFRAGDPKAAAQELKNLFATYPCRGFRPYLSMCLSSLGEPEAALRELTPETEGIAEMDPDVSYWVASAYLMAGRTDLAFKWLECSIGLGNHNLPWFERDPIWKPMREDSRFVNLMSPLRYATPLSVSIRSGRPHHDAA